MSLKFSVGELTLRAIPNCRRNSTSTRCRQQQRGAISWSAIATPTPCAAPRISPRHRQEKSAAGGTGSFVRLLADFWVVNLERVPHQRSPPLPSGEVASILRAGEGLRSI